MEMGCRGVELGGGGSGVGLMGLMKVELRIKRGELGEGVMK